MGVAPDELYLSWLYDQAGLYKRGRTRTYFKLVRHMHAKEFVWLPMKDSARAEDGKELRWSFVADAKRDGLIDKVPAAWMYRPCTVLEMVLGVARRISVLTDGDPRAWFVQLLHNLQLSSYNDSHFDGYIKDVEEKLEHLIWRTYLPNGVGGLFPLNNPPSDQRKTEIWYQMNAWLMEREPTG